MERLGRHFFLFGLVFICLSSFARGSRFNNGEVDAIVVARDGSGKVYVGGTFMAHDGTSMRSIGRLRPDGSADPSFISGLGFDGCVYTMSPATDGSHKIYVGGWFSYYDGMAFEGIVRLSPDGRPDGVN